MAVNREYIVGVARDGNQSESVASVLVNDDNCEGSRWTTSIATLAVDEGRIRGRDKASRGGGDMIPSNNQKMLAIRESQALTSHRG